MDAAALLELAATFESLDKSDAGPVDSRPGLRWVTARLHLEDVSASGLGWDITHMRAFEGPSDGETPDAGQAHLRTASLKVVDVPPQRALLCAHKGCAVGLRAHCATRTQELLARWHVALQQEAQWQDTWASMCQSL
jgi:hypothetical protein